MDAPLLLALARAKHRAGCPAVENVTAGRSFLALSWVPDRREAFEKHGWTWVLLLAPQPELWLLHDKDEAFRVLKTMASPDLTRLGNLELKGARLTQIEGDPQERWLGLCFERRAITGRQETSHVAFQAIPGRSGLRLDTLGGERQTLRLGLGKPFPEGIPVPEGCSPALQKWQETWGSALENALQGQEPAILPGEGSLLERHHGWSLAQAERLFLAPRRQAAERVLQGERKRLERYGEVLRQDQARHRERLQWKDQAAALSAELYRLKGASGKVELLDGTILELPPGTRAEEAAQQWFRSAKRAERGLARVQELEQARLKQLEALELPPCAPPPTPPRKTVKGSKTMDKETKRQDGKGQAFRSVMVEGFEVLIGKGDADNDTLTFKVANPCDLWLHVAGVPGSHVIIRNPDKLSELPREVLERAAQLAAFHSKAREGGKVEVHLCRAADVSKPRGFAPGKVLLKTYKSIRVYPKG